MPLLDKLMREHRIGQRQHSSDLNLKIASGGKLSRSPAPFEAPPVFGFGHRLVAATSPCTNPDAIGIGTAHDRADTSAVGDEFL